MNGERRAPLAERKALLRARADLDRTRLTFAVAAIRATMTSPRDTSRSVSLRPMAAIIVGILAPTLGAGRVARWLRYASFGLTAYRIAKNWHSHR